MKRVLLVSNYVFHYRQKNYNYFADRFAEEGYEFHVLANEYQDAGYAFHFHAHTLPFSVKGYERKIEELRPDIVILFLHLKDLIQIPLLHYCKRRHIPVIFWNKGLSSEDPDNPIKNAFYHHIHNHCDAIITYTPELLRDFQKKNHNKIFIAYNTVNCSDIDKAKYNRAAIREKYGIKEDKVILYISRMRKDKRIEVLLDAMANQPNIAVVAMGAGMRPDLQAAFDSAPNLYYLGQKYGEEGLEVWAIGDVFSVPVNVGLGVNEAIFWGMPIVTMQGKQAPEIYFLKDGQTGFITANEAAYKEKLLSLLSDAKELARMKAECEREYEQEVSIERMFQGFLDAVHFCEKLLLRKGYVQST